MITKSPNSPHHAEDFFQSETSEKHPLDPSSAQTKASQAKPNISNVFWNGINVGKEDQLVNLETRSPDRFFFYLTDNLTTCDFTDWIEMLFFQVHYCIPTMVGSSTDEFQDRVRHRYVCLGGAWYKTVPDIPLRFVSLLVHCSHPLFSHTRPVKRPIVYKTIIKEKQVLPARVP